jgi:hypothetical protein
VRTREVAGPGAGPDRVHPPCRCRRPPSRRLARSVGFGRAAPRRGPSLLEGVPPRQGLHRRPSRLRPHAGGILQSHLRRIGSQRRTEPGLPVNPAHAPGPGLVRTTVGRIRPVRPRRPVPVAMGASSALAGVSADALGALWGHVGGRWIRVGDGSHRFPARGRGEDASDPPSPRRSDRRRRGRTG